MTAKASLLLSIAFIAGLTVVPGMDGALAYERQVYEDTAEYNDNHYVVSPYRNQDNPHLKTIYEAPHESKGLTPVELTFQEGVPPLVLFADGEPQVRIITIESSQYYLDCATLVKKYLDLATGASFEIVDDDGTTDRPGIYIGPLMNEFSVAAADRAQDYEYDGFNVVSFANGIALCGREADPKYGFKRNLHPDRRTISWGRSSFSRGTLMASLDFLERFVGIRWYCPGRVGVFIPDLKGREVVDEDLLDPRKEWTQLRFGPVRISTITGRLRMRQDLLQRRPMDPRPTHDLPLAHSMAKHAAADIFPPLHVVVHPFASGTRPGSSHRNAGPSVPDQYRGAALLSRLLNRLTSRPRFTGSSPECGNWQRLTRKRSDSSAARRHRASPVRRERPANPRSRGPWMAMLA